MSNTLHAKESGIKVPLDPDTQRVAIRKLRQEQRSDRSLTIGSFLQTIITKVLNAGGVFELDPDTRAVALKMLKERQREDPSMTLNDMCVDIVTRAVAEYANQHPSDQDLRPQQIFGCSH